MKVSRFVSMFILIVALIMLGIFQSGYDAVVEENAKNKGSSEKAQDVVFSSDDILKDNISDNFALYINDDPYDVVTLYLTVRL